MAIKTINRVEVTPKKATKRDFKFVLRKFKQENGKYWILKDQNDEETIYTLAGPQVFDMTDKFQKSIVEGLKIHPIYSKHLLFIDHKAKAEESVSNAVAKAKAFSVIQEMQKTRRSFARALGMRVDGIQDVEVHSLLLALADKNADPTRPGIDAIAGYERILNLYNDPTAAARMLLTDGKRAGVFKVRGNVWYFNDAPMGNSVEQALDWVSENEDLVSGINKDVASKLKAIEG